MFWQPESVICVGLLVLAASALKRMTMVSFFWTDNSGWPVVVGEGVTVSVPVFLSYPVIVKLTNGVLLSGRPMTDTIRPTGLKVVFGVISSLHTMVLAVTLSTFTPTIPPWMRCFALIRIFET